MESANKNRSNLIDLPLGELYRASYFWYNTITVKFHCLYWLIDYEYLAQMPKIFTKVASPLFESYFS